MTARSTTGNDGSRRTGPSPTRATKARVTAADGRPVEMALLELQRTAGNRAVAQLLRTSLQRKRADPGDGPEKADYARRAPVYELAKSKGAGYLSKLEARREDLTLSEEGIPIAPLGLHEKNYDAMLNIAYTFETTLDEPDDPDEHGQVVYGVNTASKTDETNFYHNNIQLPSGKVFADNNQAGENKHPPANSDVIWYQYTLASEDYIKRGFAKTAGLPIGISSISREEITNDETRDVIWMVFDNDVLPAEKAVPPGSDDWKALLGTPNGKSSVWLLHDRLESVGPRRSVAQILLTRGKRKGDRPEKQYMQIDMDE